MPFPKDPALHTVPTSHYFYTYK